MDVVKSEYYTVAIGGSAGSLPSILDLVRSFPKDTKAVFFVVLHRPPNKKSNLEEILGKNSDLKIKLVGSDEHLEAATIYISDPSMLLTVNNDDEVESRLPFNRYTKSINELFTSLAENVKKKAIGIVLSGALNDGTEGLMAIKKHGGIAIVQSPGEAAFNSMPVSAINNTDIDFIGKVDEIIEYIKDFLKNNH